MVENFKFELYSQEKDRYLESHFNRNRICPLCKKNENASLISQYKNVYSELISRHLQIEESTLLDFCLFKKCSKCSLLYWEKQLSRSLRCELYEKILPTHPKGSDASGEYFSLKGLKEKIKKSKNDINRIRRIKEGYLSSFIFKNNSERISSFNYFEDLNNNYNINKLNILFSRGPRELSRHAGFRNTFLNHFIIKEIDKLKSKNYQYIEYGCPTWGPLNTLIKNKYNCLSVLPKSSVFWNKYEQISDNLNIIKEEDLEKDSHDFSNSILGLILILDHLEDPLGFLKNFLNLGVKSIAIIVEKININTGLPIQHLTGWKAESLIYLANSLDLKVEFLNQEDNNYIFTLLKKSI